ncbi:hypothetical protein LTR56_002987 [Elasticomyces elasticus]|nr:hypothetical protein LTR22_014710 [Elasticomyces elasticus]KAK3656639.1 hypothetical protein LTR56_002987 [Elasticomyces elasticus]KAK4930771.1 hypothetical protein LTR49_002859 [Elasticomyces elasticus]KAK5755601.1 hypothetical protein LTS12_014260 [Elasticomyces elasticus]
MPLHNAVTAFSVQRCTDRQDTVYGLLALTNSSIVADYSLCPKQLYARALVEGVLGLQATVESSMLKLSVLRYSTALARGLQIDLTVVMVVTGLTGVELWDLVRVRAQILDSRTTRPYYKSAWKYLSKSSAKKQYASINNILHSVPHYPNLTGSHNVDERNLGESVKLVGEALAVLGVVGSQRLYVAGDE